MAPVILLTTADFNNLIHCGPLRYGHQLHRHPDVQGYAIADSAGHVAFWDRDGKPFLTLGSCYQWVADHRPTHAAPVTRPLSPIARTIAAIKAVTL